MKLDKFISLVKEEGDFKSSVEAKVAVASVFKAIQNIQENKEEVTIPHFGKFYTAVQKGKTGTIPGSTKKYTTEDKLVPKFKASSALKDTIASK
jgi:DNA-binding protein HU-beta